MATQTQVMRGNGVGLVGRLSEVRSRIGEAAAEFYAEVAEFKTLMAWGLRRGITQEQFNACSFELAGWVEYGRK